RRPMVPFWVMSALLALCAAGEKPRAPSERTVTLKGMKVTLSPPTLVAKSKDYLWFPTLVALANGDLLAIMQNHADNFTNFVPSQVSWSSDQCKTWGPLKSAQVSYSHLRLPNGDQVLLPYYLFPRPAGAMGAAYQVCPKGSREIKVIKEG